MSMRGKSGARVMKDYESMIWGEMSCGRLQAGLSAAHVRDVSSLQW